LILLPQEHNPKPKTDNIYAHNSDSPPRKPYAWI
jgi:hypothetical protein